MWAFRAITAHGLADLGSDRKLVSGDIDLHASLLVVVDSISFDLSSRKLPKHLILGQGTGGSLEKFCVSH